MMTTPVGAVAGNAQAAQREEEQRSRGKQGNFFSRKYGPLPGWGWAALAGGGALVWFWWRKRSNAQAASGTGYTTSSTGISGADFQAEIQHLQNEIDQLYGKSGTGTTGPTPPGTGPPPPNPVPGSKLPTPKGLKVERDGAWAVRVGWDKVKGAVAYEVKREGGRTSTTALTHHSFATKPDTHYTWRVRAINGANRSEWATGSFTTKRRKTGPNAGGGKK